MSTNDSSSLMDESEIRDALSPLRIDRDAFGRGVRERVEQAVVRPVNTDEANTDETNLEDRSGLLRIAASVLPVNLLGANTTVTPTSLSTVGVFKKAIAYLALPAISFLMIAVTIRSWSRIRKAQQSQSHPQADLDRMEESLRGWWRRYGWFATIVFALSLAAPFVGLTTPLLLLFMASAIGTASIVTTLGKAGLVDRDVVGGICSQVLGNLGSVSFIYAITNKTQLLDPYLVTATFYAGQTVLLLFASPGPYGVDEKYKESRRKAFRFLATCIFVLLPLILLTFIVPTPESDIVETMMPVIRFALIALALAILAALILGKLMVWHSKRRPGNQIVVRGLFFVLLGGFAAVMGQSLWRPIGTSALVQHAETFEPRTVGYWKNWQATARWLQDQGIDYDQSAVQSRWLDAWNERKSKDSHFLNQVVSTGLRLPPKLIESKQFKTRTRRLLANGSASNPISQMYQYEWVIAALAEEGTLTNEQRDHLAGRLLATWRSLNDRSVRIEEAAIITNLFALIDHDLAQAERKADVGRWLGEYQVKQGGLFSDKGGFRRYSTLNHSNELSTEHAVRLMEHYGTHDSVDVLALRAYLRPAWSDRLVTIDSACARTATRQRLDQIPGIPQPSLWDYFRLNQSQWFAMLMVGLCVYATLGSPQILKEASDQK